jgi:hypothetical protein
MKIETLWGAYVPSLVHGVSEIFDSANQLSMTDWAVTL